MGVGNLIFAVLTALVAVNCIFAEKPGHAASHHVHVDKLHNHGLPSKENNTEKKQEGTISLSFDSPSHGLSSSCKGSPALCHSTNRGIALRCHGTLSNGNASSSSPGSQDKSA